MKKTIDILAAVKMTTNDFSTENPKAIVSVFLKAIEKSLNAGFLVLLPDIGYLEKVETSVKQLVHPKTKKTYNAKSKTIVKLRPCRKSTKENNEESDVNG